jgi:hypothetical protein
VSCRPPERPRNNRPYCTAHRPPIKHKTPHERLRLPRQASPPRSPPSTTRARPPAWPSNSTANSPGSTSPKQSTTTRPTTTPSVERGQDRQPLKPRRPGRAQRGLRPQPKGVFSLWGLPADLYAGPRNTPVLTNHPDPPLSLLAACYALNAVSA